MSKKKVDWIKLWKAFNSWISKREECPCPKCGASKYRYPEWDEQQKKIQQLVNEQLGP